MAKTQDKRRARRIASKRPARVKSLDGVVEEMQGQTRDVSAHGMFFFLSREVAEGARLEVVLPLPEGLTDTGEQWVRCQCRIVRVEPGPHAHQFGVAAMIESFEPLAEVETAHA